MSLYFQPSSLVDESDKNPVQNSVQNIADFPSLVNLLKEQSDLIKSLQKTIESLNARLEQFEVNARLENARLKKIEANGKNYKDENVVVNLSKNEHEKSVHENSNLAECNLKSREENNIKSVHEKKKQKGCGVEIANENGNEKNKSSSVSTSARIQSNAALFSFIGYQTIPLRSLPIYVQFKYLNL